MPPDAPLHQAWREFQNSPTEKSFTIPGHKYRTDLVGDVVGDDVPLFGALASVKQAPALLVEAEAKAAELWGADWARFSVAGSTHANQATVLAVGEPGDTVIVGRTLHRSVLSGLIMAGLTPEWIYPEVDAELGVPVGFPVSEVRRAVAAAPDAKAIFIGDPSYVGTCSDIAGIAEVAHEAGMPLIVDAAWAAYFGFHPDLPAHALAHGADALVTSAHKTLPTWTQGALVLARTERLDLDRLEVGFDLGHTTSPSGTILASLDAGRDWLATAGQARIGELLPAVAALRERLDAIPGVRVLGGAGQSGLVVDPLKVGVLLAGAGVDGNRVEQTMLARGFPIELAERDLLLPVVAVGDDAQTVHELSDCLADCLTQEILLLGEATPRPQLPAAAWTTRAELAMTPTKACFSTSEMVTASSAIGRICAEMVAPYPPGVPVLAPGEVITVEVIEALRQAVASGVRVAYAAEPTLRYIKVVNPGLSKSMTRY